MDYTELVKSLRYVAENHSTTSPEILTDAADAIEELQGAVSGYEATTDVEFVKEDGHERIRFVPKWIPATERLPEMHTNVLVMDKARDMAVGSLEKLWDGEVWVCPFSPVDDEQCPITHWMPLPAPPGE